MTMDRMRAAKAAKHAAAVTDQASRTVVRDGYKIRPAIGKTGGADNVGWELIPLCCEGPIWYFATLALCVQNIPRHAQRYGGEIAGG
jgi:hypothetical protein